MKVRAKDIGQIYSGFYGTQRRRPGDEFEIEEESHFSDRWMERLEEPKKRGPKPKAQEQGE